MLWAVAMGTCTTFPSSQQRHTNPLKIVTILVSTLLISVWPSTSYAYEEDMTLIDGSLGYSRLISFQAYPQDGVVMGGGAAYGLTSSLLLRGRAEYGLFPSEAVTMHRAKAGAEFSYLFDLLTWVPFTGIGAQWVGSFGDDLSNRSDVGLSAHIGLDWLGAEHWIVGLTVRGTFYPTDLNGEAVTEITAGLRFSWKILPE